MVGDIFRYDNVTLFYKGGVRQSRRLYKYPLRVLPRGFRNEEILHYGNAA